MGEAWTLFAEEESVLICWLQEEEEGSLEWVKQPMAP